MKEIPLTQGQVALVDDEDFEFLNQWKWNADKNGNSFYAQRNPGVKSVANGSTKTLKMHRVILDAPKGAIIDHVDGNGLNNQRNNLRIVSKRQNSQNYHHVPKTSKYPGVAWYSRDNKWRAIICYGKKRVCLGKFESEINAFRAYYDAVLAIGEEVLGFPYPDIPVDEIEVYVPDTRHFPKPIMGINVTNPDDILFFESMSEAHRLGGFCITGIYKCCQGVRNQHHGYRWQLAGSLGVHQ